MFYKIYLFGNSMIRNDIINKTMVKFGPPQNQAKSLKGSDKSYPKMHFSLNLSYCVKSNGRNWCHILACFTMNTQKIWSSHVIQVANFVCSVL